MAEEDIRRDLERAHATIASQAIEIDELRRQVQANSGLAVFRELLQLTDIVTRTVGRSPYQSLLNGIVEAARGLFEAGAASILIHDGETNELVIEAAADESIIGLRLPANKGIAGWVLMSGESMAVGDVRRDPRWASDFAQSTGYVPKSIMAAPLLVGDEVEGVIEVLDKSTAATFGLNDLDLLGLFARPAAIALEQARTVGAIGMMIVGEMERLADERGERSMSEAARTAVSEGSTLSEDTIMLTGLIHSLNRRGERSRRLALDILESVVRYTG